jgi:tyrosyl-tRNA synthetase
MLIQYFDLLTEVPDEELTELGKQLESGAANPMELKKRLARDLVAQLHGGEAAREADEHFSRVFQKREMPEEVEEVKVAGGTDVRELLVQAGLVKSKSEAARLIQQGAVSIDGARIENAAAAYKDGSIIKVGKHRFIKVVAEQD